MPQSGDVSQPSPSSEESLLDLLVGTLDTLDDAARGPFLRQFFRALAQVELTEAQSIDCWKGILQRRREVSESGGRPLSLRAILVDVLTSANLLRVPVLMEYEEFKKLQINAATDGLTGLYNRRLFDEYCEKELNRAKRYGHQLAVVIMDLRKLKEVNDRHGHLRGDQILQLATATLRRTLRSSDFAFRIGGDEFALLLPQTDSEQATTLCRRVRSLYEAEVNPLNLGFDVTLDYGVAVYPEDGERKNDLVAVADKRQYELKARGGTEAQATAEKARAEREAHPPIEFPAPPRPPVTPTPMTGAPATGQAAAAARPQQRKWERVSLVGTKAYAVLAEVGQKSARVVDLSYGGVSLLLDKPNDLPAQFNAVLHVPILPPVRVVLRKAYTMPAEGGRTRVGCAFVS